MELLPLVCLCLLSCSGDAVRVVVKQDSDAVLPCLIRTKEDIAYQVFDWKKDGQQEVFMYDAGNHYNNGLQGQDEQFKGRVSFFQDQLQNGNASIKITRTKMADSGTYSCDFPRHQSRQTSIIELVVARVRVVVEEDSDAVLNCLIRTKEDISGELFHWSKDDQKVFLYDAGVHSEGEQFKGRVSFFQDQLQNGDASIKITRTKMADSGNYSCGFPRHQPRQTSIIELVVDPVLRDRTGENIPGAAPEPCIMTLDESKDWSLLQCEAHGDPRPTIKWEDSENNILPAEETQISDRGGRFYITVKITVTKTDNYRCVATQETLSHQIAAVIPVHIQGAASKPYIRTIKTDDGMVLQCEVLGASPKPKVEWKDSSGNVLQAEEPQVTVIGGRYDIVLRAAVTKTDSFRCVVTQEEISHQISDEIHAVHGPNTGWIVVGVVCAVLGVPAVLYMRHRIKKYC